MTPAEARFIIGKIQTPVVLKTDLPFDHLAFSFIKKVPRETQNSLFDFFLSHFPLSYMITQIFKLQSHPYSSVFYSFDLPVETILTKLSERIYHEERNTSSHALLNQLHPSVQEWVRQNYLSGSRFASSSQIATGSQVQFFQEGLRESREPNGTPAPRNGE